MRDQAICPTAAEACQSSSFKAPGGRPSTERPKATAPEDTTSTSAPRRCSAARSSARPCSQALLASPRARSTSSEEPTFTTMRLNCSSLGRHDVAGHHRTHGRHSGCGDFWRTSCRRASMMLRKERSTSVTPSPAMADILNGARGFSPSASGGPALRIGALQPLDLLSSASRRRPRRSWTRRRSLAFRRGHGHRLRVRRAPPCRPCRHVRRWRRPDAAARRQRSTWPRKRSPRPRPSCAPSIRPGISASTNSFSSSATTPRLGCSVVKG